MQSWLTSLIPSGTAFILAVQRWSNPFWDHLFLTATYLGVDKFLVLLVALAYWCIDRRVGINLAYLVLTCDYLNGFLKNIFREPRPAAAGLRVLRPETSPGFPSAHAQEAVAVWGYLATQAGRPIAWAIAVVIISLIAFSRIYLGVHFPHDIIGGLLIGAIFLVAYQRVAPSLSQRWQRLSMRDQILLAIGAPLFLWLIHPAEQIIRPEGTVSIYPSISAARDMGFLAGAVLGMIVERRHVRFQVWGPWWKRLLRFLLGAAIVVIFWQGPKWFIPRGISPSLDATLHLLRYTLAGMAAIWWAPWLFVRLKLAPRQGEVRR
ncbi:MAG: phosphatase PAP2 family protein [Anaerolineae bacterium]|nr:phosphatase PAP2 family protein [Anaerolineae bacterium]